MDFAGVINKNEPPHQRTIIHLSIDYFYAQVEEIRDPTLSSLPMGVQQKNHVVSVNYIAEKRGVKNMLTLTDAKSLCPELVLVNGEDLTPYRKMSEEIFEVLLNYTPMVEKFDFNENYMDVTSLVNTRQLNLSDSGMFDISQVVGHIYPDDDVTKLTTCDCGCTLRLTIGAQIAKEIRDELKMRLNITCCAGISYNKLLAKLVGGCHKPNQQTTLISTYTEQFMRELKDLHRITGINQKTEALLMEHGIRNVEELQRCDIGFIRKKLNFDMAKKLKDLSFGRDSAAVRPSRKLKSVGIGIEDACRIISIRIEIEERFRLLLIRLLEQVAKDGRIPIVVKVTLRKYNPSNKTSHRESKQANILPSLFKTVPTTEKEGAKVVLADGAQDKILKIIMRLFERVVDLRKPFNITLIGLAFSKFHQRKAGSASIANFLMKKTDLEVQSITSLTNSTLGTHSESPTPSVSSTHSDEMFSSSPTTFQPSDQFYRRRGTAVSPIPMLIDNGSESGATNSDFSDISETEVETSCKKSRMGRVHLPKRRCFHSSTVGSSDLTSDVPSPSKLRVSDLHLNSRDSDKDVSMNAPNTTVTCSVNQSNIINSPTKATTLSTLSLCNTSLTNATVQRHRTVQHQTPTTIFTRSEGFRSTVQITIPESPTTSRLSESTTLPSPMDEDLSEGRLTLSYLNQSTNFSIPGSVNQEISSELPQEAKNELINSWRNSIVSVATVVANGNISPPLFDRTNSFIPHTMNTTANKFSNNVNTTRTTAANNTNIQTANGADANDEPQKNALCHYFLRNK